jgi:hypothetical protein
MLLVSTRAESASRWLAQRQAAGHDARMGGGEAIHLVSSEPERLAQLVDWHAM